MKLRWKQGNKLQQFNCVSSRKRFYLYRTRRQHKKMFHVKQYLEWTRIPTIRRDDDADTNRKEAIDVQI